MSFNNPVVGGENGELIRAAIHSPNYVMNVSGWTINRDGSAEFSDITIRGGAIVGGSITIGPAGMPQVVIDSDAFRGFIEFPSNASFETDPASIFGQSDPVDPVNPLTLRFESATITNNVRSFLELNSETQDLLSGPSIRMGLVGPGLNSSMNIRTDALEINAPLVTLNNELFVNDNIIDGNFPVRVARGKVAIANTITTLGIDTLVGDADCPSTRLENGVAYKVEVQIATRSSVGTSAAGTQVVQWKLWDGAVGGTQIGQSVQKTNRSVGTRADSDTFSFTFEHTGLSGVRTLNLSGSHTSGTDTFQAIVNSNYEIIVNRIGDPDNITNL